MSNHLVKAYKDDGRSSGSSLHSPQSCWMARWAQPPSNQGSLLAPHSQTFSREEGVDHKQKPLRTNFSISSDIPRSYGVIRNNTKAETAGLDLGSLTIRAQNVGKERSDYAPFFFLGDSRNRENTWTRTPLDPSCSYVANSSSALRSNPSSAHMYATHERADPNLQPSNFKSSVPNHAVNPGKITVFKSHFSKNDFTSLNQGSGRREKYSAIVVHGRSAFSPLLSNNYFEGMEIDCQADAPSSHHGGLPCPVRNAEAVRICPAVDSAANSHGLPPLYSKTTTHHVLFSSRAGVAHESTQHRGVKIQPLWSSTDSEKDNFGDAETPRCERSFDVSTETDTMDVVPHPNDNNFLGMLFPPIAKSQSTKTTGKTLVAASVDPWEDKVRGKLRASETPGTDSMEPSTSRTQSLEAEHLFSCAEQLSVSKTAFPRIDERALQEPGCSRSVKRVKLSSSGMGESSSRTLFNMMMEHSKESAAPLTDKHQSEEPSMLSRTKKNPIFQSSWIQRWCQDGSLEHRHPSKSIAICEADSSNLALDELDKKQFPSIAAVAMMGKSVDGFHACKFTKRGPLVVWNSEDY